MRPPLACLCIAVATACASGGARAAASAPPTPDQASASPAPESLSVNRPQYPSAYQRHPYPPVLITHATIMTATGQEIRGGSILLRDGKIAAVGTDLAAPAEAIHVDGTGKYVTPGIIDVHSHLGVYAAPATDAESDGNELTGPVTAEVWAEHSFWPQDPQIPLAIAGYRGAFIQAEDYRHKWDKWNQDHKGDPPERNLRLETLAEVLRGNIFVQNHCYRADEMAQMLDLAREFGFKIRA